MAEDLHTSVSTLLRDADQRYTSGRRTLVEVLRKAGRPLTAAEIFRTGDLAQSSAYRNLSVLESCGVVHRVSGSDEFARFELAEHVTDHHHHHLICTNCGDVADFPVSEALERSLDAATAAVAEATGFLPEQHRLDLLGLCASCR